MENGGFFLGLDVPQKSMGPLSSRLIDTRAFYHLYTNDFDGRCSPWSLIDELRYKDYEGRAPAKMMENGGVFLGLDVLQKSMGRLSSRLIDTRASYLQNTIAFDGRGSGRGRFWSNFAATIMKEGRLQKYDGKWRILSWP